MGRIVISSPILEQSSWVEVSRLFKVSTLRFVQDSSNFSSTCEFTQLLNPLVDPKFASEMFACRLLSSQETWPRHCWHSSNCPAAQCPAYRKAWSRAFMFAHSTSAIKRSYLGSVLLMRALKNLIVPNLRE